MPDIDARAATRAVALRQELSSSFGAVSLDTGITISEADLEGIVPHPSAPHPRELDTECTWRELAPAKLEAMQAGLSFLDPLGVRFYLPAYLDLAVKQYEADTCSVIDSIMNLLVLNEPALKNRVALLDAQQRDAVREFLRFVRDFDVWGYQSEAEAALQYWNRQ